MTTQIATESRNAGGWERPKPFPRDVLEFAGIPVVSAGSGGQPYGVWSDRHGGCFLLPEVCRGNSAAPSAPVIRGFTRAFPQLGRLDRLVWRTGAHDRLFLEGDAVADLSKAMNNSDNGRSLLGLHIAVPGAYRKLTAVVVSPDFRPLAFGKLAAHEGGKSRILAESETLRQLEQISGIQGRVPRLIGLEQWGNQFLLVVTAGPERRAGRRFSKAHREFLTRIYTGTLKMRSFHESGAARRWRESIEWLTGEYSEPDLILLRTAVACLEDSLCADDLPVTLAHGDFTSGNTRRGPDGLFVFDWEAAIHEALPGHDAFHFGALPNALRGRELRRPPAAVSWIRDLLPGGARILDDLWLGFLVELGLQYARARVSRPEDGDDRVLTAVISAIAGEIGGQPPNNTSFMELA